MDNSQYMYLIFMHNWIFPIIMEKNYPLKRNHMNKMPDLVSCLCFVFNTILHDTINNEYFNHDKFVKLIMENHGKSYDLL